MKRNQAEMSDSIVFARPQRDALGRQVTELSERDGAQWRLVTVQLMVPMAEPERSPLVVGSPRAKVAPIFVPMWEVIHIVGERAVVLQIPEELASVRMPRVVVDVCDAAGALVEKKLMTAEQAARYRAEQERRASLERGEAAEH